MIKHGLFILHCIWIVPLRAQQAQLRSDQAATNLPDQNSLVSLADYASATRELSYLQAELKDLGHQLVVDLIQSGDAKRMRETYITCPYLDFNSADHTGTTPLTYSVAYNSYEVVDFLVNQARVDLNAKDNNGMSALACAIMLRRMDVAYLLLTSAADISGSYAYLNNQTLLQYTFAKPDLAQYYALLLTKTYGLLKMVFALYGVGSSELYQFGKICAHEEGQRSTPASSDNANATQL